jgi:hypothetical protein
VSHSWQLDFVGAIKKSYPEFFTNAKVLEVGSLDINGSIRPFFENCDYLGVDLGEGRGVDMVAKGEELAYGSTPDIAGCGPESSGRCGFVACRHLPRFR